MSEINTPVVFMFFNRHETAMRVLERIRIARPRRLVLVSDGPRLNVVGEAERVSSLRHKIEGMIDWDVDVEKDYASENLGCARRLSSGIEAVFSRHEKAIFIEDDCLPANSFFPYAEAMLNKYERDIDVLSITGSNFLKTKKMPWDYGFTHFPQIWGWAGWARTWEGYDLELKGWDNGFLYDIARSGAIPSFELDEWLRTFDNIRKNPLVTWDVQFWMLCLKKRGLHVFPYKNQITNIGYGADSTHTSIWWFSNKPQYELCLPLALNESFHVDLKYEKYLQQEFYGYKLTHRNFVNSIILSFKVKIKQLRKRAIAARRGVKQ